jgi:molybdate transport system regulatory protein
MPSNTGPSTSRRRILAPLPRIAPRRQTLPDAPAPGQQPNEGGPLRVRTKVWIEGHEGGVVMSAFRAGLLLAIEEHRSVAAAARAVGLPYRTAWKKLQEMERSAGIALLASEAGGLGGGQTALTDAAREMLAAYHRLSAPAEAAADAGFERERAHFEVQ